MTVKKGLLLTHTHRGTKEVEFQGVVSLSGGVKVLGPFHNNKGTAKAKIEKALRKLDVEVDWITK